MGEQKQRFEVYEKNVGRRKWRNAGGGEEDMRHYEGRDWGLGRDEI